MCNVLSYLAFSRIMRFHYVYVHSDYSNSVWNSCQRWPVVFLFSVCCRQQRTVNIPSALWMKRLIWQTEIAKWHQTDAESRLVQASCFAAKQPSVCCSSGRWVSVGCLSLCRKWKQLPVCRSRSLCVCHSSVHTQLKSETASTRLRSQHSHDNDK